MSGNEISVIDELEKRLNIRYIKLRMKARFLEDTVLPEYKTSMLRGGLGEMLLRYNCVRDRRCESCDFESECIVQRTMYSKFEEIRPAFSTGGDSFGYILNCENFLVQFSAGQELDFTLTLFGKAIAYFNLYMQAFYALGASGIGKNSSRFCITEVANSFGEPILEGSSIRMENYKIETAADYVRYRKRENRFQNCSRAELRFRSPLSMKSHDRILQEIEMEPLIEAVLRRIYILDCFENLEYPMIDAADLDIPVITEQSVRQVAVPRFSTRKNQKMVFHGFVGSAQLEAVTDEAMTVLLAGELLQVGKNTSFGFGRYRLKQRDLFSQV